MNPAGPVGAAMLKTANGLPTYWRGATASNGCRMIRLFIILPLVVIAWFLVVKLIKDVKSAKIDWTGVATIVGFIVLAFWLRHVTGMG